MNDIFAKYRRRLKCVGLFRSAASALALSLFAVGAASLAAWAAGAKPAMTCGIAAGIGIALFLALLFLFYFRRFRPTEKTVAEKLDGLGLDERAVTMYEHKNDPSPMAALQRQDAEEKISVLPKGLLKFSLALPVVLLLVFGAAFAAGATAFSVLKADDVRAAQSPPDPVEDTAYFTVTYAVYEEGTGSLSGKTVQTVKKGGYTEPVAAMPANGFRFVAWVDENLSPLANQNNPRSETNVRGDMTVFAYFEKADQTPPDEEQGGGSEGQGGDLDPNPGGETDPPEGEGGGHHEAGGGGGSTGGGGSLNNGVIDGTQDYQEQFDREALEKELADKEIPDDLKDILGDYYDTLKP